MREKNNMDRSPYYFNLNCNMRVNWNKPASFAGHQVFKRDAKRQKRSNISKFRETKIGIIYSDLANSVRLCHVSDFTFRRGFHCLFFTFSEVYHELYDINTVYVKIRKFYTSFPT